MKFRKTGVLVAGGGVSGAIAAIAAAREGVETLVVERYGFLGGMFTGGNMVVLESMPFCGIGKEIVDRLMQNGYARLCPDDPPNNPILHFDKGDAGFTVAYDNEMAKWVLLQMAEEAGVKIQFHSFIVDTLVEDNRVRGAVVASKSGLQAIEADIVVDATSDCDVAAAAGAPFYKGHPEDPQKRLFAMTKLVRLSHVDWNKVSEYSKRDPGFKNAIKKAKERGELPYYRERRRDMVNYWGHEKPELSHWVTEDGAILWGGTVENVDGTKVEDLTHAEIEATKQYMSEINFLKKYIPGFENARIETTGVQIGVRDTRHIIGEYTLTGKDLLEKREFEDGVAYGHRHAWFIQIPYRCLIPKNVENLLVCGNGISAVPGSTLQGTWLGAYNNLKNIPTMMSTGQAAGTAAALCVKTKTTPRQLDINLLKKRLKETGALVEPEVIKEYVKQKLLSGLTMEDMMERLRHEQIEYWKKMGQI